MDVLTSPPGRGGGGGVKSIPSVNENNFRGGGCPRGKGEDRGVCEETIVRDSGYVRAPSEAEPSVESEDPFFLSDYIIRVIHLSKNATLVYGRSPRGV